MKTLGIVFAAMVAAMGILVVGPASSASAAVPSVQYFYQNFFGTKNTLVVGSLNCPFGSRMVSAGAGGVTVSTITPSADFTSATASGIIRDPGYMQFQIGCAATSQIPGATSRTTTVAGGVGYRRGEVYCPPGTRAFGGGAFFRTAQGAYSIQTAAMVSNTVTADGTGWTFRGITRNASDELVIRTQCAPLTGSFVTQTGVAVSPTNVPETYGTCPLGSQLLSGGVYLSKPNGTEADGVIAYSWLVNSRWYVSGDADRSSGIKVIALAQCLPVS